MKRLLLAGLAAGAALSLTTPADATILACDNAPVHVQCYSFTYREWCTVWVQATRTCLNADRILGPLGA